MLSRPRHRSLPQALALLLATLVQVGTWSAWAGEAAAPMPAATLGPTSTTAPSPPPLTTMTTGTPTRALRVDFVAVGHGDAVLITSPTGKTVLIDGGLAEAGETVAAFVRSRTEAPIDLVMLTHRHADHLGGLGAVISQQGARAFMDAVYPHPSPAYAALVRLLEERHIPVREATRGRVIDLGGDARLVLLTPPQPLMTGSRSDVNANSLVARLEHGRVRMLLTGDAEAVTESWLLDSGADVRADVLKLAHHGSRYSSTARFLGAVSPRVVVVSCGPAGRSGAAHPETLARVGETGARVYRTDLDGRITVTSDGRDISIETQHGQRQQLLGSAR